MNGAEWRLAFASLIPFTWPGYCRRYVPKPMNYFATLMFGVVCCIGCTKSAPEMISPSAQTGAERQRIAINEVLVAHHPHFTQGKARSPSLNVDAFNFMIGRSVSDFPTIFTPADEPVTEAEAKRCYRDERIAEWIKSRTDEASEEPAFYVFDTAIGRTFNYDAQMDYLAIETNDDIITAWEMFAITLY